MTFLVRTAEARDAGIISMLRERACDEAKRYRGHVDSGANAFSSAVVEINGEVVGIADYVDIDGSREVLLIHVHESVRNIGAGDEMMLWLVGDARTKGCRFVRSSALPGDRATKNLFERHGLVARAIQVEREIG